MCNVEGLSSEHSVHGSFHGHGGTVLWGPTWRERERERRGKGKGLELRYLCMKYGPHQIILTPSTANKFHPLKN